MLQMTYNHFISIASYVTKPWITTGWTSYAPYKEKSEARILSINNILFESISNILSPQLDQVVDLHFL